MFDTFDDELDMHTTVLERCQRHNRYRVIEVHIPGIQGPGVGSGGGGGNTPSDDDIATDEDIEDLFPDLGGGGDDSTDTEKPGTDDNIATDDDIKDLFPGL